jgi:carbonic anhydrase/acetyltransferase-like protein (isoleucine patch superfamily)
MHKTQTTMKERIKRIAMRYPILEKYLRIILSAQKTSKSTILLKGKENILDIAKSAILYNCTFDVAGEHNKIVIGELSILNNVKFYIRGNNNNIDISRRVSFHKGGLVWVEDHDCQAIIGQNTTIEDSHFAITEPYSKIRIGEDCMFAYDIDLRTGDSHSIIDSISKQRINYAKDINIGNHVWIASHVSILKGVSIADNSVVATRAVVTKTFTEKNILIGGMPAKKIKENIDWKRERL